jgi:uncharacterized damage-inducible protein DinB
MESLLELMAYDAWANAQVLDAAARLSRDEREARPLSGFPSIHQTLVHLLWAEELWLRRWQGESSAPALDPAQYPGLEAVREHLDRVREEQGRFLGALDPAAPGRRVAYRNFKGERWEYTLSQMVQHLVVHSAHHRGQVAALLRHLGRTPPHTDYLVFIDALAGASE